MRIVFLCGSLEFGRDGVGDYTRRLSSELIQQGQQVGIVALYDQYLETDFSGTQTSDNVDIPVLRLPSILLKKERFNKAKRWIDNFNPKWLSLQFVPFSFHPQGLPFRLSSFLNNLSRGRHWHIMFHELWVGMDIKSTTKEFLWGQVQRKLIQSMVLSIKPKVIHTQTHLYQTQLYRLGFETKYLSLFSNIPIHKSYRNNNGNTDYTEVNKNINFVVFGSIHPGAPIEIFTQEVAQYARKKNVEFSLTIIGRTGEEQKRWKTIWESMGLIVEILGEQTSERISETLQNASIGISTTPSLLVEKSGTVAAMFAHNLPVISVSRSWSPRGVSDLKLPDNVFEYKSGNLESCLLLKPKDNGFCQVSKAAQIFTASLLVSN